MTIETKEKFKFRLNNRTLIAIDWANVYGWSSNPDSKNYLGWEVDPKKLFDYLSEYTAITDKRLYHGTEVGNARSEEFGKNVRSIGYNFITKEVKWTPVFLNEQNHFRLVVKRLFDVLDKVKVTNSEIATKLYELREKIEKRLGDTEANFDSDGNVQDVFPAYGKEDQEVYDSAYELIESLDDELKSLNINIDDLQKELQKPVQRRKCDFDVEIARDTCNLSDTFDTLLLFSGDGDYSALAEDLILKGKKVIIVFAPGHKGKEYDPLQLKLETEGKKWALFMCNVGKLKNEISLEKTIPPDFSGGRDTGNIADNAPFGQGVVDN